MSLAKHIQEQQCLSIDLQGVLEALDFCLDRGAKREMQEDLLNTAIRMALQLNNNLDVVSLPKGEV